MTILVTGAPVTSAATRYSNSSLAAGRWWCSKSVDRLSLGRARRRPDDLRRFRRRGSRDRAPRQARYRGDHPFRRKNRRAGVRCRSARHLFEQHRNGAHALGLRRRLRRQALHLFIDRRGLWRAAHVPVSETESLKPMSPYGRSKLMVEWMLEDTAKARDLSYVVLRYFNVAGADPQGRIGQSTPNATHLIKVAVQTALWRRQGMEVFGTDFPTPDGWCLRDYIQVTDLARAHVDALNYLRSL